MKLNKKVIRKRTVLTLCVFVVLLIFMSVGCLSEKTESTQESTSEAIISTGFAAENENSRIVDDGGTRISEILKEELPQNGDIIDFVVVLEKEPLLSVFTADDIRGNSDEVENYRMEQIQLIDNFEESLRQAFGDEEGFQLGFSYTVSTTGISVKTRYENKAQIEQMDGVEKVYVSPTFELADLDEAVYTNNASAMIGATQINEIERAHV